jgi:hypothetical protein
MLGRGFDGSANMNMLNSLRYEKKKFPSIDNLIVHLKKLMREL